MRHASKTILLTVAAIVLCACFCRPAHAFGLSLPGVGIEVQGPRGSVSFPYGAVHWGPHGGAVVFPGGKVKWRQPGWRVPAPTQPWELYGR
ncbi:MAG: hypothetical protein ACP5M0_10445 [Desulfomonilaceae bacterium]